MLAFVFITIFDPLKLKIPHISTAYLIFKFLAITTNPQLKLCIVCEFPECYFCGKIINVHFVLKESFKMNKNNKRKGFTILELVIVIAAIAILAGVMIPTFAGVVKKAQISAIQQEAQAAYKEAFALAIADGTITEETEDEGEIVSSGNYQFAFHGTVENITSVDVKVKAKSGLEEDNYGIKVENGIVKVGEVGSDGFVEDSTWIAEAEDEDEGGE